LIGAVKTEEKKLRVPAVIEKLPEVQAFIIESLGSARLDDMVRMNIDLAVEEVFVNIASYAYPDTQGEAEVTVSRDDETHTAHIVFSDSGIAFDPLSVPPPDLELSAEERPVGGLGIFLLKEMAADVSYVYENGRNILGFTMKLE